MQYRNDNILQFAALGDAAAVPTEALKPREHRPLIAWVLRLEGYGQHPRHTDAIPGKFSDDAHRAISNAHVQVEAGPSVRLITERRYVERYVGDYKADPRAGFSKGYKSLLDSVRDADDFQRRIKREASNGNGCAMGAAVIGAIPDPIQVMVVAKIQAMTTHNTESGIFTAQAIALMSHFLLWSPRPATRSELGRFLNTYLGREIVKFVPRLTHPWTGPVKRPAHNTVHAVFDLLTTKTTLAEVLRGAIRFGGDTDTVASIALSIASARMPNDIPQVMFDQLEPDSPYGPAFLVDLGTKLMDTYT